MSLFDTSGNNGNTNSLKIWSAFEFRRLLSFQFYPFHVILFEQFFRYRHHFLIKDAPDPWLLKLIPQTVLLSLTIPFESSPTHPSARNLGPSANMAFPKILLLILCFLTDGEGNSPFSMLNYSNNSHRVEIIWETNFCLLSNYCIHLRPQNQSVSSKITVSALLTRKCLSAWMESNLTNWAYTVWTLKVWSEGSATPPGWDSNANGRYLSGKFWREMRPQRTLASQLATALFDERKKLLFDWLVLAPL